VNDGITTCPACGAQYLRTALVACAECGTPFGGTRLEPGDDEVGYDLADWFPALRAELVAALADAGTPHRWDGDELVVREVDAEHVDELIDRLDNPDALDEEEDDGAVGADVLSALYVSADVLQHEPDDTTAVVELLEAVERAPEVPPYGIEGTTWRAVLERAGALADSLGDDADPEDVVAAARALRELVRPLV
jgi:hypothetical protein